MYRKPGLEEKNSRLALQKVQAVEAMSGEAVSTFGVVGKQAYTLTPLAVLFGLGSVVALILTLPHGFYARLVFVLLILADLSARPARTLVVGPNGVALWKSFLRFKTPERLCQYPLDALTIGKKTTVADHRPLVFSEGELLDLAHHVRGLRNPESIQPLPRGESGLESVEGSLGRGEDARTVEA